MKQTTVIPAQWTQFCLYPNCTAKANYLIHGPAIWFTIRCLEHAKLAGWLFPNGEPRSGVFVINNPEDKLSGVISIYANIEIGPYQECLEFDGVWDSNTK